MIFRNINITIFSVLLYSCSLSNHSEDMVEIERLYKQINHSIEALSTRQQRETGAVDQIPLTFSIEQDLSALKGAIRECANKNPSEFLKFYNQLQIKYGDIGLSAQEFLTDNIYNEP